MKRSALIIPILTGAVLAPVAPAVAVAAPAPVSQSAARQHAQVDAEQALAQVNARIAELHKMPQAQVPASEAPKVNYGEETRKLLDTAFELRTAIESIIAGKVPPVDLSTIPARVDLLTTSVKTIQQANHNLVNKVEAAHVELGFSITRALIRT
ncbi:CAMP factor family pore-forming toxin, partial [Xanthomonas citri pv. citri]|nr:CAMP factor family pore-forming toxin [Xanthomonas citri pv. citri]